MDILKAIGAGASLRESDNAGDRRVREKPDVAEKTEFASRVIELQNRKAGRKEPVSGETAQMKKAASRENKSGGEVFQANAEEAKQAGAVNAAGDAIAILLPEDGEEGSETATDESAPTLPAAPAAELPALIELTAASPESAPAQPLAEEAAETVDANETGIETKLESDPAIPAPAKRASAIPDSQAVIVAAATPAAMAANVSGAVHADADAPATPLGDAPPLTKISPEAAPLSSTIFVKAAAKTPDAAVTPPVDGADRAVEQAETVKTETESLTGAENKPASDSAPKKEALLVSQGAIKLAPDALASSVSASEPPLQADASIRSETLKTAAVAHARLDAPEAARQIFASIRADKGGGVDLRLDPPDLGRVRIQFSFERSDVVVATVSSERGETLDLMRRHSADLARELQRAGFESVTLEFASGESKGSPSREASAGSSGFDLGDDVIDAPSIVYVSARADNRLDRLV